MVWVEFLVLESPDKLINSERPNC